MIHTILINGDNTITKSMVSNIMHRSSNVDSLRILVDPVYIDQYGDLNMAECVCLMECVSPISREYTPIVLTSSEALYKNKLEYIIPIDIRFTKEVGDFEFKFIFTKIEMLSDGSFRERSRKTLSSSLQILPVEQWSEYIPDANLDSIAQMILTNQAQMEQLRDYANYLHMSKADTISYNKDTNELSIGTSGRKLDSVILEEFDIESGVPVVEFSSNEPESPSVDEVNNVVEF